MSSKVIEEYRQLTSEESQRIIEFRHYMHEYPEISNEEIETTKRIKQFLAELEGIEILELPVKTGVVAILKGAKPGRTVGLRCDIDAIPQTEQYSCAYKSHISGVMHACGHDTHTAAVLGAAMVFSRLQNEIKGNIVFLFQKAEETTTGAKEMIEAGLFDIIQPDMFFALHNWPTVPTGQVICKRGALMSAKTNFVIKIKGHGGHGSMPHLNIDPIVCASAVVMSLQTVLSRNINPLDAMVFSINSIQGGSVNNLVVDDTTMTATIRSLSATGMKRAKERMERIVQDTCRAYECSCEIEYIDDIPLTFNPETMYSLAYEAAEKVVGKENIVDIEPTLASEDFAFIMQRVPSFMYWFGSAIEGVTNEALHQPSYHANDGMITVASNVLVSAVLTAQDKE